MARPKKGPRFGEDPEHQGHIMANLAASLFEVGYVTTTVAKAKMLRPYAEKLVTKAAQGGLHNERIVVQKIHDKRATAKLFKDIGPRYDGRNGGYLRILKLGPRPGDAAPMARVEFV